MTGCGKPARPGFHFKRSVLIAMACCIFSQSGLAAVVVVGDGRMLCRFLATQRSASVAWRGRGGRDPSLAAGVGTERCVVVAGVVLVRGFAKPAGGAVMTYSINLSDWARVPAWAKSSRSVSSVSNNYVSEKGGEVGIGSWSRVNAWWILLAFS